MPGHRIELRLLAVTLFLCALCGGCQTGPIIKRKPVEELLQEAILASDSSRQQIAEQYYVPYHIYDQDKSVLESSDPSNPTPTEAVPIEELPGPVEGFSVVRQSTDIKLAGYQGETPLLSETFEQTDLREAIQILASLADQQVIVDDNIGGVTTASIEDATFEEALTQVLAPLGYVYAKAEDTYVITPPDPQSPLFHHVARRASYQGRYHDVKALMDLLPERYHPFLKTSAPRNLITIEAPESSLHEIITRLTELDSPVPQVELEAIVCVVAPDSGFRFGLDWNHVVGIDGVESLKAGISGLAISGSASADGINNAFSDFAVTSAFVRSLADEGYISIRAAPRVTARDGEKAEISIARETFFSLQPASTNVLFRQDVQKVEAGIGLDITPKIRGNIISVQIDRAEVSEDIRTNEGGNQNSFPVINRRTVSTNIDVHNGETIVIGGLVQRQQIERINRVPGVSEIPLIGRAFRTIERREQDVEVAIIISPRIVHSSTPLIPELTNETTTKSTSYAPALMP